MRDRRKVFHSCLWYEITGYFNVHTITPTTKYIKQKHYLWRH